LLPACTSVQTALIREQEEHRTSLWRHPSGVARGSRNSETENVSWRRMDNLLARYRNVSILVAVLFAQVLGLAVQVKRANENQPARLIRIWTVGAITPFERAIMWFQGGVSNLWQSYVYLRGVRQENRDLKAEIQRLRLEQVRLHNDAAQAQRLQALLGFREQYASKTLAAQVIGSSGSEQSRSIYIDKGSSAGIEKDMPVITVDGVVGKVLRVFGNTAQVLLINDQSSGVGAILEKSRLQGILRGTPAGEVVLEKVMADEMVDPGERVLTSGGDQIFPKGLTVGFVTKASPGAELFLIIRVHPAANLGRLEEVLVITKKEERSAPVSAAETAPMRASDILAQRLPSVPEKPALVPSTAASPKSAGSAPVTSTRPQAASTANVQAPGKETANNVAAGQAQAGTAKSGVHSKSTSGSPAVSANPSSGGSQPNPRAPVPNTVKPASAQKSVLSTPNTSRQLTKASEPPAKQDATDKPTDTAPPEEKPQ
jgi:rod shape-determining protein MreC